MKVDQTVEGNGGLLGAGLDSFGQARGGRTMQKALELLEERGFSRLDDGPLQSSSAE